MSSSSSSDSTTTFLRAAALLEGLTGDSDMFEVDLICRARRFALKLAGRAIKCFASLFVQNRGRKGCIKS
jgi:hypothetical protein